MLRRIFDKKLQDGEIILHKEGARNVHERPFPNNGNDWGKGHAITVFASEQSTERDTLVQPEGDHNLDKMVQWVQKLFKVYALLRLDGFQPWAKVCNNQVHRRAPRSNGELRHSWKQVEAQQ